MTGFEIASFIISAILGIIALIVSNDSDKKMKAIANSQIHEKLAKMNRHLMDTNSTLTDMDELGIVWTLNEIRMLNNDFNSLYYLKDYASDKNKQELIKYYIIPIIKNLYNMKKKYQNNPHNFEKEVNFRIEPNEWKEWEEILTKIANTSLEYNIETEMIKHIINNQEP